MDSIKANLHYFHVEHCICIIQYWKQPCLNTEHLLLLSISHTCILKTSSVTGILQKCVAYFSFEHFLSVGVILSAKSNDILNISFWLFEQFIWFTYWTRSPTMELFLLFLSFTYWMLLSLAILANSQIEYTASLYGSIQQPAIFTCWIKSVVQVFFQINVLNSFSQLSFWCCTLNFYLLLCQ